MAERRFIGPTEQAAHWKSLMAAETKRLTDLEAMYRDKEDKLKQLAHTAMGRTLLTIWEGEIAKYSRELETMEPDPLAQARVQAILKVYRLWVRLLTREDEN